MASCQKLTIARLSIVGSYREMLVRTRTVHVCQDVKKVSLRCDPVRHFSTSDFASFPPQGIGMFATSMFDWFKLGTKLYEATR